MAPPGGFGGLAGCVHYGTVVLAGTARRLCSSPGAAWHCLSGRPISWYCTDMRTTTWAALPLLLLAACSEPTFVSPCNVACYDGPPDTLGVGTCRSGHNYCDPDNVVVNCARQITPVDEVCNGLDDDCDGIVDNIPSRGPCGSSLGACESGLLHCAAGTWDCIGAIGPQPETFDCVDNDCDGVVDNDAPKVWCYTGDDPDQALVGTCRPGYVSCTGDCVDQVTPRSIDICGDQLDNDCDGLIDEEESVAHGSVAVVMIVDRSGSMDRPLRDVRAALTGFARSHTNDPLYNLYLIDLPGGGPSVNYAKPNEICHDPLRPKIEPCPVDRFIAALARMDTGHGGTEPSWDAIYDIVVGTTSIAWPDAPTRRYVVFFGDEHGQSLPDRNLTEAQVASAIAGTDITFYGYVDLWGDEARDYDDIANASGGVLVDLHESRTNLSVSFESIATPFCE